MTSIPRHKVFISFYHEDQYYKEKFAELLGGHIVDKSVSDGDIDDTNVQTETIRRKIRDGFIADATVTAVLIGPCTWQRKHVDWEIGSSLRDTKNNSRCGLLGILLPNHPNYQDKTYNPRLIPPRLSDNCGEGDPFAKIYHWHARTDWLTNWIHQAFLRRNGKSPDNSRPQFGRNRGGPCGEGWKN